MATSLYHWAGPLVFALLAACGGGGGGSAPASAEGGNTFSRTDEAQADLAPEASGAPLVTGNPAGGSSALALESAAEVQAASGLPLASSGFEGSYPYTAPGWRINWWGTVRSEAAPETRAGYVHSGSTAQRFRVVERAAGSDANLIYPFGFAAGKTYQAVVYLRTDTSAQVEVLLRRDAWPWNGFASQTVTLGSGWTRVVLQGTFQWADPGSLRIVSKTLGANLYVDDMSIAEVVPEAAATAPAGGLTLPAAGASAVTVSALMSTDMEGSYSYTAPGWRANYWGSPTPVFELARETRAGYVHGGTSSQRFRLVSRGGGDAHLIYPYAFVKGRTYRASAWLRSDVPARVTFYMRRDTHPYDPFATRTVELTSTWQKVEIQGSYLVDSGGSLRLQSQTPGANIWLDDASLSEVSFNELAPFSTATLPDTLFGLHVNRFGSHQNWPALGQHTLRLHNTGTHWKDLEPTQDGWNWSSGAGRRLDMLVDYARRHNPNGVILYTLGFTPAWASCNPTQSSLYGPGSAAPPLNMEDWRDYVRTLARRYAGRIRHWELWNEPDYGGHYTGSMAQLVTMARIAREELKAADPGNVLVSGGLTTGQGAAFLDGFLAAGGGQQVDAIGFHWYYDIRPEGLARSIENVRQILRNHGLGARPIWNTEGAPLCNRSWQDCASWVPTLLDQRSVNVRALMVMAVKGIANFNFYFWESGEPLRKLVEPDWLTPTPASLALAEGIRWMKGARVVDAFRVADNVHVFRLDRGTENHTVLWAAAGDTLVNLPSAWGATRLRRLDGTESALPWHGQISVGVEPVLLK